MLRGRASDRAGHGRACTGLDDDWDRDDSALRDGCPLKLTRSGAAESSAEQDDAAAAAAHTGTSGNTSASAAWQRRSPCALSKTNTNIFSTFNGISVWISIKLTHQKSNRRLSPTAPSKVWVRQWSVDPVWRETVGEMFFVVFFRSRLLAALSTYIHSCFSL